MVFFTCDACGESLKKNAVEKHYQFQCRNCSVLSCVDCGKDFPGDTYAQHTSCISEAEKYSGKDFKPKPNANKGERKQTQWTEQVQAAIAKSTADFKLKGLLERLMDYPNIPRKKAKFQNFVKNSMGVWDATLCERTWNVIAAEMTPPTPANTEVKKVEEKPAEQKQNGNAATNGDQSSDSEDVPTKKLNKKERKEERQKLQNKDSKKQKRKQSQEEEAEEVLVKKKKSKKRKHAESEEDENEEPAQLVKKSKKKKKKEEEEEDEQEAAEEQEVPTFTWEGAIVGVLRKADDKELPLKKLRKKVLAQYYASGGDAKIKTEEDLLAKFNKKVNKNPRLHTQKERVKLLH